MDIKFTQIPMKRVGCGMMWDGIELFDVLNHRRSKALSTLCSISVLLSEFGVLVWILTGPDGTDGPATEAESRGKVLKGLKQFALVGFGGFRGC